MYTCKTNKVPYKFCCDFLLRPEDDECLTAKIVFSDEAILNSPGNINGLTYLLRELSPS
jgi:hypothetical protein